MKLSKPAIAVVARYLAALPRTMALHNSRFRNHSKSRRVENAPELSINPKAAERLGLGNGDWVQIKRERSRTRFSQGRTTDEVPPEMAATGMGWWYSELAGPDHGALTFNVETAIPYGLNWNPSSSRA